MEMEFHWWPGCEDIFDVLQRFETARRILGHGNTMSADEVAEATRAFETHSLESYEIVPTALTRYAKALLAKRVENEGNSPRKDVVPMVDIINCKVTHTTCTGGTTLTLDLSTRNVALILTRNGVPFDPTSGRDVALTWLADIVNDVDDPMGASMDRQHITPSPRTGRGGERPTRGIKAIPAAKALCLLTRHGGYQGWEIAEMAERRGICHIDIPRMWEFVNAQRGVHHIMGDRDLQMGWVALVTNFPEAGSAALPEWVELASREVSGMWSAERRAALTFVPGPRWDPPAALDAQPDGELEDWERDLAE